MFFFCLSPSNNVDKNRPFKNQFCNVLLMNYQMIRFKSLNTVNCECINCHQLIGYRRMTSFTANINQHVQLFKMPVLGHKKLLFKVTASCWFCVFFILLLVFYWIKNGIVSMNLSRVCICCWHFCCAFHSIYDIFFFVSVFVIFHRYAATSSSN